MTRRHTALLAAVVVVVAAVSIPLALTLAPALLLLAILASGRHPGERMIERLRARLQPRARRIATAGPTLRLTVVVRRIRRGLASATAIRPPPPGGERLHTARLTA